MQQRSSRRYSLEPVAGALPRHEVANVPLRDAQNHAITPRAQSGRREITRAANSDSLGEYIGFSVENETFALPLATVREILKPPPITEVPRARPDILGIVSVRGQI